MAHAEHQYESAPDEIHLSSNAASELTTVVCEDRLFAELILCMQQTTTDSDQEDWFVSC